MLLRKFVRGFGSARAERVLVHWNRPRLDRGVDRVDDRPRRLELVASHEMRLMAVDRVEDETLVRSPGRLPGHLLALLLGAPATAQFHLGRHGLHPETRLFDGEFHVHLLVRLDPKHELVRARAQIGAIRALATARLAVVLGENVPRGGSKLDANLASFLVERLSGFEDERDAVPSFVSNVENHHGVRRGSGSVRDARVVAIAGFPVGGDVLSRDDVLRGSTRVTWRKTLSFASRMSSGSRLTGRSIASTAMTCRRWFCITSRTMPCLSKYSAVVPMGSCADEREGFARSGSAIGPGNGSAGGRKRAVLARARALKMICTFAIFSRSRWGSGADSRTA